MNANIHTRALRVPVGSLIPVAPPGAGTSTILRDALLAAGLPAERVVSRAELRRHVGVHCAITGHRMVPQACTCDEPGVSTRVAAAVNSHLIAGRSWLPDEAVLDEGALRAEADRAHRQGLAAVALRRVDDELDGDLPFSAGTEGQLYRPRSHDADQGYAQYRRLTPDRLRTLGFDVVLPWNAHTRFELLPEGIDARGLSTRDVVVVGDIHGCAETFLDRLLPAIGTDEQLSNPDLLLVSVGDIHDKGGRPGGSVHMIRWWLSALRTGRALLVDSNHSKALVRALTHPDQPVRFGLAQTLADIDAQPDADRLRAGIVASFSRLPSHLVFDDLVVVHAAMTENRLFRSTAETRGFALHRRFDTMPWTWTGSQTLVHGHVVVDMPYRHRAVPRPSDLGRAPLPGEVIDIDTGAYRGGGLTAYRHAGRGTLTVASAPGDVITAADAEALDAELARTDLLRLQPAAVAA
jgi:hypothetical protein